MSTAFLDSFQLVIALYLFYIAFKGDGQMYRFGNLSEEQQAQVKKPLRIMYTICGFVALSEFGVSSLMSQMFTKTTAESGAVVMTQNFTISGMPFITYSFLSILSSVLSILVFVILIGIVFWLLRKSKKA